MAQPTVDYYLVPRAVMDDVRSSLRGHPARQALIDGATGLGYLPLQDGDVLWVRGADGQHGKHAATLADQLAELGKDVFLLCTPLEWDVNVLDVETAIAFVGQLLSWDREGRELTPT